MSDTRHHRRLVAILAADVAGYTRAMADDESGTLDGLHSLLNDTIAPQVAEYGGRIFKTMGDGILAEFASSVDAAECAVAIQSIRSKSNAPLKLRIGLHVGDVIVEGDDLFGDGVNIATRLQAEAEPNQIAVSNTFRRHAEGRFELSFHSLGKRRLKNLPHPMEVYLLVQPQGPMPPNRPKRKRRLLIGSLAASALLLLFGGVWYFFLGDSRPQSPAIFGAPAIAILPFENLSQDAEQAYFADGLAEDLIADLAKIESVHVVSRRSSFADWVKSAPIDEIAEKLKVRYVVEGSVRRASDQLRITTSLIDTSTNLRVWSQRFEGSNDDVFSFQDQIIGEVIASLRLKLSPSLQDAVKSRGTDNPAAYDAYLRGMRHLSERRRLDTEGNAEAQRAFEEAIALDPDYALAYAGLGWAKWLYIETIYTFTSPDQAFSLAEKSLSLGENALAHRTLARQHFALLNFSDFASRKIDQAVVHLEAARKLSPSDPDVLADLALALPFVGRPGEAVALIHTAMERNPNHPAWYYAAAGIAYLLTEKPELAVRDLERWSAATPSWNVLQMFLVSGYGLANQPDAAKAAYDKNTATFGGRMSVYAAKRKWPMRPDEEEIFLRGLRIAGVPE